MEYHAPTDHSQMHTETVRAGRTENPGKFVPSFAVAANTLYFLFDICGAKLVICCHLLIQIGDMVNICSFSRQHAFRIRATC